MEIKKKLWSGYGQEEVYLLTLSNGTIQLSVTNLGCSIVSIMVPDKKGTACNVVLGYDDLQSYFTDPFYMGCVVGRFANRISKASFRIKDKEYALAANEQPAGNHLHGGTTGFNKKIFTIVDERIHDNGALVQFHYRSTDMEEGYPGNLDVFVTYELTRDNEVIIDYSATTDKATHVNLTNHSYFNLSGSEKPVVDHNVFVKAAYRLVADDSYIPTGEIIPVTDTVYDLREWRSIGNLLEQLPPEGCNACFIFDEDTGMQEVKAGLHHPQSGRTMLVRTSLPALMLYTGDYLQHPFRKNQGVCLETQFYPDAPNRPEFPQTILYPGEEYRHQTVYHFIG